MPRHVCFIAASPIADEPRVRHQGDALHHAGYTVSGVGTLGRRSEAPQWPVVEVDFGRLSGRTRVIAAAHQARAAFGEGAALAAYWSDPRRHEMLAAAIGAEADVYVAREWRSLPIALRAAAATGGRVALDSPELSSEEMEHSVTWRWFFRPMITAIEGSSICDVGLVTVVGDEIGHVLEERYQLATTPTTLRNLPPYEPVDPAPAIDPIEVLFHGGVIPLRGIEEVIDSMSDWPPSWTLRVRGNGSEPYLASLRDRAARAGSRVTFEPAVPLDAVVRRAAASHVGVFALPGGGRQREFALPNKLFEYLMGGLAVTVSDLPEMARIVHDWDCGTTIARPFGPSEIAVGINQVAARLTEFRSNALTAARNELNWDREAQRYAAVFASSFGPP